MADLKKFAEHGCSGAEILMPSRVLNNAHAAYVSLRQLCRIDIADLHGLRPALKVWVSRLARYEWPETR